MSKRVVAIVNRGMTDKTPVVIWTHEIPILEAIHGEDMVSIVDPDELTDRAEALVVRGSTQLVDPKAAHIRLVKGEKGGEEVEITGQLEGKPHTVRLPVDRVNAAELVARGLGVGQQFDGDVEAEYTRLAAFYGFHNDVKMPVVECVYGRLREGRFAEAVSRGAQRKAA